MLRRSGYILVTAVMLATAAYGAAGQRAIRIMPAAAVADAAIRLRDVAVIQADEELRERLADLVVGEFVPAAETVLVGSFDIAEAIQGAGAAPASFRIYGARHCEVRRPLPVEVPATQIPVLQQEADSAALADEKCQARQALTARLDNEVARVTGLATTQLRIEWRYPERQLDELLEAGARLAGIRPRSPISVGLVRFDVTLAAQDGSETVLSVSARVYYRSQAVVAMRALRAGEVIGPDDVRLEMREVTDLNDVALSRLEQAVGQECARAIRGNQAITPGLLRKVRLVQRRDQVEVIFQTGVLNLRFQGRALGDGGLGDDVLVHNPNNDTVVGGVVTGPGEVTVTSNAQSSGNRQRQVTYGR